MIGGLGPTKRMAKTMAFADFVLNAADIKADIENALAGTNKELAKRIKDIDASMVRAEKYEAVAVQARKSADAYVEKVSLDAERAAGDIRATALKEAESLTAPLVKREKAVTVAEKQLAKNAAEVSGHQERVLKREAAAEKKAADANAVVAEYTQRSAKLQKALEGV